MSAGKPLAMSTRKCQSATIKSNLECPVCFEDYSHITKIPKCLLCGHTACTDCLKNISFGNHIQCPVCRKKHASTRSIDDLPTNFIVLSMVDSMCQDCRNTLKTDQCLSGHCNQELCDPCRERHLQAFNSDYQQAFSTLQAEITQLEASCSNIDGLSRMLDQENKVIKQVNNMCDGFNNRIHKMRTTTKQDIKAKIERYTNSILQKQENLRKGLNEGKKIVAQSMKLNAMSKDLYAKCETLRKELGGNTSLSDITTLLPDHLDVSYSTRTQAVGSLNRERSSVKPVISIVDYRSYTGRVVYEVCAPLDISVSQSKGVIAFTDYSRKALFIVSDEFEALTSYNGAGSAAGKMRSAWGTVISRDNKIFVSDNEGHNIHVIDVQGRHLYQIGLWGRGRGHLSGPRGLAMDEDDTLFVCDSENDRICCFRSDGSFIRQFGRKGDSGGHFTSSPQNIGASRFHDKVAVSDWDGNLYIFSHGGDHHRTIRARTAPYNMKACGLAIDAAGCIIVADKRGPQLLVLDNSLQVVAKMGSGGHGLGQLSWPRGVVLTARAEVLVCDYWNNIQIFSNNHN